MSRSELIPVLTQDELRAIFHEHRLVDSRPNAARCECGWCYVGGEPGLMWAEHLAGRLGVIE